jgi:hypothetical protein
MVRRVDESPPGNLFLFADSPLRTACQQRKQTIDKKQHFVVGNADALEGLFKRNSPILDVLRNTGRQNKCRTSRSGYPDTRGMDEIIENAHVTGKWNSHHRVWQVPVKSWKEPEAVLARKIRAGRQRR